MRQRSDNLVQVLSEYICARKARWKVPAVLLSPPKSSRMSFSRFSKTGLTFVDFSCLQLKKVNYAVALKIYLHERVIMKDHIGGKNISYAVRFTYISMRVEITWHPELRYWRSKISFYKISCLGNSCWSLLQKIKGFTKKRVCTRNVNRTCSEFVRCKITLEHAKQHHFKKKRLRSLLLLRYHSMLFSFALRQFLL